MVGKCASKAFDRSPSDAMVFTASALIAVDKSMLRFRPDAALPPLFDRSPACKPDKKLCKSDSETFDGPPAVEDELAPAEFDESSSPPVRRLLFDDELFFAGCGAVVADGAVVAGVDGVFDAGTGIVVDAPDVRLV